MWGFDKIVHELDRGLVFTPNVDHLMRMQRDEEFWKLYQQADYRLCDSQILLRASRWLGTPIQEQIAGSDLFPAFCKARKASHKVFLLGGRTPEVTAIACQAFADIVVGGYSPHGDLNKIHLKCSASSTLSANLRPTPLQ